MTRRKRKQKPDIERFSSLYTKSATGCWLWHGSRNKEKGKPTYGRFTTGSKASGNKHAWLAHRFSWVTHIGPIPDGMFVLHKCDVMNCVNPDHLFLGTQLDNVHDMMKKGRQVCNPPKGEDVPAAKLSNAQVQEIRAAYVRKYGECKKLADRFGVSVAQISRIVNAKSRVSV